MDGLGLAGPGGRLLIAAVILAGTWNLFRQSLHLLFDGVPDSVDAQAVHDCLANQPGVSQVIDLHIWAMSTQKIALTAQLVMPQGAGDDAFLKNIADQLHDRFGIEQVTVQTGKTPNANGCRNALLEASSTTKTA